MRKNNILPFLLAVVFLIGSIFIASKNVTTYQMNTKNKASTQNEANVKMRGVWISYMTLDMQDSDKTEQAFVDKINSIVKKSKECGFNTLIFQIRPFCDALYKSDYYPYSHILTGEQGKNPKYDPLEIICDICHNNGMNVHAWLNPYRISTQNTPDELSKDNPYMKDKSIGFEYNGCLYLDPSSEKAQTLIVNGVKEIVSKYDVDGIQFDDYFYPEGYDDDTKKYDKYTADTKSSITKEKWRMQNVNTLVKKVYDTVHKYSDTAVFGISPQGNLSNNKALCADVHTWCEKTGYVDYICPQIYFSLDNPKLTYEDALDEWLKLNTNSKIKMYVGLAGYKGGTDADEGTWLDNDDILKSEAKIADDNNLDGIMLYSYDSLTNEENRSETGNLRAYLKNN